MNSASVVKEAEEKVRGKTKFEFVFQNEASPSECPDFKTAKKLAFEIEEAKETGKNWIGFFLYYLKYDTVEI